MQSSEERSKKPAAASKPSAASTIKPAAAPKPSAASTIKPAAASKPSAPASKNSAASTNLPVVSLKKPAAVSEQPKPSDAFYSMLIRNLDELIAKFRTAFSRVDYSLQPRIINGETKPVEDDPLLAHNPGNILFKFLKMANAALNEHIKPPFNFDDLLTIIEFFKQTEGEFFVNNASTIPQVIKKQQHLSMWAIVDTIRTAILNDIEKPTLRIGGNFDYQNIDEMTVIALLEKLVASNSEALPSGEILWRLLLAINRKNGPAFVKNNADLIAKIRRLFSFYTYDPFKAYPNLSIMAIEHPWIFTFFTSRQLTEFLITCPQESIDALKRTQDLQPKTTSYREEVFDVGKSLFSSPIEAVNEFMRFPTLSREEKNKRVLVNFLVDPRVAVFSRQVINEVFTINQNNGAVSLRQFLVSIGGFPREFTLFLNPSTLIDLYLEFDDQATVRHKDLLATMEVNIDAATMKKHIQDPLLLTRVEGALKRGINPRVYINQTTNTTYLLDANAVRGFIESGWLLTRIETDLENGVDAQCYFNSKKQIPYLLYELVKRDALLNMPLPSLVSIFKTIHTDHVLETLQLLDPENESTCCIVIGTAKEKYMVDKSNKATLLRFVQILLTDEFLSLRLSWVQDQRAEQLIIQYPILLKGLSYKKINEFMRNLDNEKRQVLIDNAVNCLANDINPFVCCPFLLSYLSPEKLIQLAALNKDIHRLLVGNFDNKGIDRLPVTRNSSAAKVLPVSSTLTVVSALPVANILPVVSALSIANALPVVSVVHLANALPHEVILDFIRKNHFSKLLAAIPELNGAFTAEYFKKINPELLDEQLLVAIISNETSKMALKQNPTILRYFNPDVIEGCAKSSSFLRQVVRQFDLIELILATFDDLFDKNFDLLKRMIAYLYLTPDSLAIYNKFVAKIQSAHTENQSVKTPTLAIDADVQRFTAIKPYTTTKEFPEHLTIEDLEAVLASKESDPDRIAADPMAFLADPIVFLIESMIKAYPKWLNRFIQSPGFYSILIKYCSHIISKNMNSSDVTSSTLYQRAALFVKAEEYSKAINYLKELITRGVVIPTEKTKTSAVHLFLACADHVMKTEPLEALEYYILIAGELVSAEESKVASFKVQDRVKHIIQAKLVMTIEFARKAIILVQNEKMPEAHRLHLMSLLHKLLQKIPYDETSKRLFIEANALVKLRPVHLHFDNSKIEKGLQVHGLKPLRDQEALREIKRVEKTRRKENEAEEFRLKQQRELMQHAEEAKRKEKEAEDIRLRQAETRRLEEQKNRQLRESDEARVKRMEEELTRLRGELELRTQQEDQREKGSAEEVERKKKEAKEIRLREERELKQRAEAQREKERVEEIKRLKEEGIKKEQELQKRREEARVRKLEEELDRLKRELELRTQQEEQREKARGEEAKRIEKAREEEAKQIEKESAVEVERKKIEAEESRQREERELKLRAEVQREKERMEEAKRKEEEVEKKRLEQEQELQKQREEARVKHMEEELTRLRGELELRTQQEDQRENERAEEQREKERRGEVKRKEEKAEKERLEQEQDLQRKREEAHVKHMEEELTRLRRELELKQQQEEQREKALADEAKRIEKERAEKVERKKKEAEETRLREERELKKHAEEQREKERAEETKRKEEEEEKERLEQEQELQRKREEANVKHMEEELTRLRRELELKQQQEEQREKALADEAKRIEKERAEKVERKKKEAEETRLREERELKKHAEEQREKERMKETKRKEEEAEKRRIEQEQELQRKHEEAHVKHMEEELARLKQALELKQREEERVRKLEEELARLKQLLELKQQQENKREEERAEKVERKKKEAEAEKRRIEQEQELQKRIEEARVKHITRLRGESALKQQQEEQREKARTEEAKRKEKERAEETRRREELELKQRTQEHREKERAEEVKRKEEEAEKKRLEQERELKLREEETREKERAEEAERERKETDLLLLEMEQDLHHQDEEEASVKQLEEETQLKKREEEMQRKMLEEETAYLRELQIEKEKRNIPEQEHARKLREDNSLQQKVPVGAVESPQKEIAGAAESSQLKGVAELKKKFQIALLDDNGGNNNSERARPAVIAANGVQSPAPRFKAAPKSQSAIPPQIRSPRLKGVGENSDITKSAVATNQPAIIADPIATADSMESNKNSVNTRHGGVKKLISEAENKRLEDTAAATVTIAASAATATGQTHILRKEELTLLAAEKATSQLRDHTVVPSVAIKQTFAASSDEKVPSAEIKSIVALEQVSAHQAKSSDNPQSALAEQVELSPLEKMAQEEEEKEMKRVKDEIDRKTKELRRRAKTLDSDYRTDSYSGVNIDRHELAALFDKLTTSPASSPRLPAPASESPQPLLSDDSKKESGESAERSLRVHAPLQRVFSVASYHLKPPSRPAESGGEYSSAAALLLSPTSNRGEQPPGSSSSPREQLPESSSSSPRKISSARKLFSSVVKLPGVLLNSSRQPGSTPPASPVSSDRTANALQHNEGLTAEVRDSNSGKSPDSEKGRKDESKDKKNKKEKKEKKGKKGKKETTNQEEIESTGTIPPSPSGSKKR